jgi:hypothetical protein
VFWNGVVFSAIDSAGLFAGGLIGKNYMAFNAFLAQIFITGALAIANFFTQSLIV